VSNFPEWLTGIEIPGFDLQPLGCNLTLITVRTFLCWFMMLLAVNIWRQRSTRLPNCQWLADTSMTFPFPLRLELVVWMVSAMFCPETTCFSDERLSIGIGQLSPSMTQHPADLRVVQGWIDD